jgi:hypothetical protein
MKCSTIQISYDVISVKFNILTYVINHSCCPLLAQESHNLLYCSPLSRPIHRVSASSAALLVAKSPTAEESCPNVTAFIVLPDKRPFKQDWCNISTVVSLMTNVENMPKSRVTRYLVFFVICLFLTLNFGTVFFPSTRSPQSRNSAHLVPGATWTAVRFFQDPKRAAPIFDLTFFLAQHGSSHPSAWWRYYQSR